MSTALSVAGLAAVVVAMLAYLASIPKEKVPPRPIGTLVSMAAGVVCGGVAVWLEPSALTISLAATSTGLAGFFVYLMSIAPLPDGDLQVAVGDELLHFEALLPDGSRFDSRDLGGKRVLLKFFRGSW